MSKKKADPLTGAIADLGENVFHLGENGEKMTLAQFVRVKESLGLYCGTNIDSSMYPLVVDGEESEPTEPAKPVAPTRQKPSTRSQSGDGDQDDDIDPYERDRQKILYNEYVREKKEYKANKGKVFITILGQCSIDMTNKIKGLGPVYRKLLNDKDVVGLLGKIEEHISNISHKEYEYIAMHDALLSFLFNQRSRGDPDGLYEKEFHANYKQVMDHWGRLVPSKLPDGDSPETAEEKFKAVVYLRGAGKQFKGIRKQLKDNYITKAGSYPATVADAISLLNQADRDALPVNQKKYKDRDASSDRAASSDPRASANRETSHTNLATENNDNYQRAGPEPVQSILRNGSGARRSHRMPTGAFQMD